MLTADRLRELFDYDPVSGIFIRKGWVGWQGKVIPPRVVGAVYKNGYVYVEVDGRKYLAHRLAWLYVSGSWPARQIDHRNTVRRDNRFENLREATELGNSGNRGPNRNNRCGFKGVMPSSRGGRWTAQISLNGKHTHLGTWDTVEDAARAYDAASVAHFGEFAKTNAELGLL